MEWLAQNAGTIIVAVLVAGLLVGLATKLIRDKKRGKSSCSCDCGGCAMRDECHPTKKSDAQNDSHT